MNVLIIGAGWFGCHIAKILNESGVNVTIFEKENEIFASMSGNNSNRLHKGFHYPRASITRKQCVSGFRDFKKIYPFLCKKIYNNYIAIHSESKISFKKYLEIMKNENLSYKIVENNYKLNNIQGIIKCDEELIDFQKAKVFFNKYFNENNINLKLNSNFNLIKNFSSKLRSKYSFIIDCTACTLDLNYDKNILYEPRITLLYKSNIKNFALMFMDGPFWSIYPQNNDKYTIGSVTHSRISNGLNSFEAAKHLMSNFGKEDLENKIINFETQILNDFHKFKQYFHFNGYYLSLATLFDSKNDERPLKIYNKDKLISILGGKIDTVIEAGNKIKEIILH